MPGSDVGEASTTQPKGRFSVTPAPAEGAQLPQPADPRRSNSAHATTGQTHAEPPANMAPAPNMAPAAPQPAGGGHSAPTTAATATTAADPPGALPPGPLPAHPLPGCSSTTAGRGNRRQFEVR